MMSAVGYVDIVHLTTLGNYQETFYYIFLLLKGRQQDQSLWVPQQLIKNLVRYNLYYYYHSYSTSLTNSSFE